MDELDIDDLVREDQVRCTVHVFPTRPPRAACRLPNSPTCIAQCYVHKKSSHRRAPCGPRACGTAGWLAPGCAPSRAASQQWMQDEEYLEDEEAMMDCTDAGQLRGGTHPSRLNRPTASASVHQPTPCTALSGLASATQATEGPPLDTQRGEDLLALAAGPLTQTQGGVREVPGPDEEARGCGANAADGAAHDCNTQTFTSKMSWPVVGLLVTTHAPPIPRSSPASTGTAARRPGTPRGPSRWRSQPRTWATAYTAARWKQRPRH